MKKSLLLLIFSVLVRVNCFSQLTVTNNSIATTLAQTILGSGVSVSNATIDCGANGAGTFTYAGATLGVTNGIILTTGYASDASMPAQIVSEITGNNFQDPDLATIVSGSINDVCYIAFDFVPLCSQISITFEFGSSEYDGFQCASYNDAFGLFLTGPNPGGGTYTSTNIATLPSGTPVSISNINNGQPPCTTASNPSYYIDNSMGTDVVYEGLTTAITSVKPVVPCSTYHIKIAIADVGDEAYDSGVFIQGNSLNCTNTPTVTANTTAANCGTLGSATVTVTNYTATPTYQWLPGNATTASVNNLTPGTYTCLVGLQSGCGLTTQTVTAVVGSTGATFSYTTSQQNPLCPNGTNGNAGVVVSGGSAPYTYTWTTTPPQNSSITASDLPAGTYTVSVTDNIGCIGTTTVTLINPPAIVATVTTSPTTCTGSTGVATASVTSGGTAPYTYTWTTGTQAQTINNLAQGTYSVIISDVNSCTATATGTVGGQGFAWSVSATESDPKCIGSANGSATVSITNPGASTFTYSWTTTPIQTTSVTTANLTAGNYTVTVTDNNGCSSSASVTLTNPPPIIATVNTLPTMCSGATGSATVSVLSGGAAPFTYTWLTNPVQTSSVAINLAQATYSVIVIDANSCSVTDTGTVHATGFTWTPVATASPTKCFGSTDGTATVAITNSPVGSTYMYTWTPSGQNTATASNLPVGNYTVTVEDNNDCISTASVTITQPSQIVLTTQSNPALCTSSSGIATVAASGGTFPFAYSWNSNPVQTTQSATGLMPGQYAVIVTDINNCVATTIVNVGDTADLTVTATQSPDLCSKGVGKAIANPKGQTPYTYVWNTNPVQTNQIADSLQTGSYSVTVTDAFGCISGASTTVINQNDILSADFAVTPAGVINAEEPIVLNVTINGGWHIDTTAYLSNGVVITKNPFPYTFPQYGNYTATYYFTSNNGCKDTITYDILVKDYITLYIPSAFTPNGDGRNDYFEAQGTFVNSFEMYIYDRWGVLVKKMDNITTIWDGTKNGGQAPEDTYVYKGEASDIFGKHVTFHGQINLIR